MIPLTGRNRLNEAASPYLQQHKHNPVHWWTWCNEAFAEAEQHNKPVFISIGYASCHWCHVMAHESFEDEDIAKILNRDFVSIKIDREERPDVDLYYMDALHAMGEQGGWPLTIFATPQRLAFYGGTYYPKTSRYGRPGFADVLTAIKKAWDEKPDGLVKNIDALHQHLAARHKRDRQATATINREDFVERILQSQDLENGGLNGAPKFPNAPILDLLFAEATISQNSRARSAFVKTIQSLSLGGIYDHIGGGLARYSVDEKWLIPHFEKMLYDNAHYLRHLAYAHQLAPNGLYERRATQTVEWLKREMMDHSGALYSGIDADAEGEEGKFTVWSEKEISQALGSGATAFAAAYDISADGNFEGKNNPNLLSHEFEAALAVEAGLEQQREVLFHEREKRARPGTDTKILVDWNSLIIDALVQCCQTFKNDAYLELANDIHQNISQQVRGTGDLPHAWKDGKILAKGMLGDYATFANASLSLFEQTGEPTFLLQARSDLTTAVEKFTDPDGTLYMTEADNHGLPVRLLAHKDDPNPSPAAQLVVAAGRYALISGDIEWTETANQLKDALDQQMASQVNSGGFCAGHWIENDEMIVLVIADQEGKEWLDCLKHHPRYARMMLVVETSDQLTETHPARHAKIETTPYALVCSGQTCLPAITDIDKFNEYLTKSSIH